MADATTAPWPPLRIEAVGTDTERLMTAAAARSLAECLAAATGTGCAVPLTCREAVRSDFLSPSGPEVAAELHALGLVDAGARDYRGALYRGGPRVVVLSLLADVVQPALRHRRDGYRFVPLPSWQCRWTPAQRRWVAAHFREEPPLEATAAAEHWRAVCAALQEGGASVFLCNVFRHVPGRAESLRERIARFNLLAAEVSHDTGAFVVDLDSALARAGAGPLGTDYRLGGEAAAAAGAAALVAALLRAGLDDYLAPEVQAGALDAFEARHAARTWLASRRYQLRVMSFLDRLQALRQEGGSETAAGAERLGTFFLREAERLHVVAQPGHLALHRRFLAALRELGAGHLDRARAGADTDARRRAEQRVRQAEAQLQLFWKAFHDLASGQPRPAG